MSTAQRVTATLFAGAARMVTGVIPRWRGAPPTTGQQTIFFANHTSNLDFVVLWASLPAAVRAQTRPVAAADYWSHGIRHLLACNLFRAVLVERYAKQVQPGSTEDANSPPRIQPLSDALAAGDSLILFPEGTRGTGEVIAPFKSGLYRLLQQFPKVQAVPAYIENLSRVLPKGEVLPVPLVCKLTFGEPMRCEPNETKDAFLTRARAQLCALRVDA